MGNWWQNKIADEPDELSVKKMLKAMREIPPDHGPRYVVGPRMYTLLARLVETRD